jgi:hypothetical protein
MSLHGRYLSSSILIKYPVIYHKLGQTIINLYFLTESAVNEDIVSSENIYTRNTGDILFT